MKKLILLLSAIALFGCIFQQPGQASPQPSNYSPPVPPSLPNASNQSPQYKIIQVPYEANETYVEQVQVPTRVLVGPQNVEVMNLSFFSQDVNDSEEECSASLVVQNTNPFQVWFDAQFVQVMDSAPGRNLHYNVNTTVSEMFLSTLGNATLPSGVFHPQEYTGPYACRIDLSAVSITVLPHDGVHWVELPRLVNVTKIRTVTLYRNETVPA